jgi:hypothetical protein
MNYLDELLLPRTALQEMKDDYCDLHKSVYGVKARWIYQTEVTEAQMEVMLASLQKQGEAVWAEEAKREAANDAAFLAEIAKYIELGAADAKTALAWMHDAHDTGGNNEYLGFELGCSYQFVTNYFKGL